jgi:hypothetical protein
LVAHDWLVAQASLSRLREGAGAASMPELPSCRR